MAETETIGRREFRVGARYAPRQAHSRERWRMFDGLGETPDGRLHVFCRGEDGELHSLTRGAWTKWAGVEVKGI